jgi:hypothetical protein
MGRDVGCAGYLSHSEVKLPVSKAMMVWLVIFRAQEP